MVLGIRATRIQSFLMRDTPHSHDGVSNEYTDPSQTDYYDQKLNFCLYNWGTNHNRGVDYVRQMLKDNFDLDIKYYALVGFPDLYDSY